MRRRQPHLFLLLPFTHHRLCPTRPYACHAACFCHTPPRSTLTGFGEELSLDLRAIAGVVARFCGRIPGRADRGAPPSGSWAKTLPPACEPRRHGVRYHRWWRKDGPGGRRTRAVASTPTKTPGYAGTDSTPRWRRHDNADGAWRRFLCGHRQQASAELHNGTGRRTSATTTFLYSG